MKGEGGNWRRYLLEIHENDNSENECKERDCVADVVDDAGGVCRASNVKVQLVASLIARTDVAAARIIRQVPDASDCAIARSII